MSARASLVYLGTRVVAGVLTLGSISLFARGLGPDAYAWLTLCLAGASILSSLLVVPLGQTLARFMLRTGFEGLLPSLARVFFGVLLLLFVLALLLEYLAILPVPRGVVLGAVLLLFAYGIFELSAQFANSSFAARRYSAIFLLKSASTLLLGWGAIYFHGGAWAVLLVMVVCSMVSSVLACRGAWLNVLREPGQVVLLRAVRGFALPLALISFCSGIMQWADRWLLASLANATATGAYGATADLVSQTLMMVSSAFFLAWYPRIVAAWEKQDGDESRRLASRYLAMSLGIMVPAALGFALLREELATFLLGQAYVSTAFELIPWLACAACLATLRSMVLDVSLFISGRLMLQLRNTVVAAVCGVSLTLYLVPRHGPLGAAMATVCAQALGTVLSWWSGRTVLQWRILPHDLLAILLASAGMAFLLSQLSIGGVFGLVLRVMLGAGCYLLLLCLFNGLGAREQLVLLLRKKRI